MFKQKQSKHFFTYLSFHNLSSRLRLLASRRKILSLSLSLSLLVVLPLLALLALISFKSFASGETSSLQLNYTGPVPSISFSSVHSNYGTDSTNDPGAWKVDKEAHYIGDAKAKITFNIQSRLKTNTQNKKDIVLVLDNSHSMDGEKLDKAKQDSVNFATSLLSDTTNRIALVKFSDNASILTPSVPISATANGTIPGSGNTYFSSNKDTVVNTINTIGSEGFTNYFAGFKQVEEILKGYQKQNNRDLNILFMTDGYPNEDTPSEVGQYQMLAAKYPFATFAGIQYEMGDTILAPIKAISQVQYHSDRTDFGNVLFKAAESPFIYTNFVLTDYLNSTKWNISSIDDIEASINGSKLDKADDRVSLTKETLNLPSPYGATPTDKITWDLSNIYRSGSTAKLEITVTLKDPASIQENEIIPTNDHTKLTSSFTPDPNNPINPEDPNPTPDENVSTPNSPALKYKYKLSYLPNPPKVQAGSLEAEVGQTIGADACTVENMPKPQEEQHQALETVLLTQAKPTCTNKATGNKYLFKGWQINTYVKALNADYFIMPDADLTISATWSRPEIAKDMKGKVWESPMLYYKIAKLTKGLDTNLDFSKMDLATSGVYTYDKASPNHPNLTLKSVAEGGPVDQYNGDYIDPQSPRFNPNYISHDLSGDSNSGNKDIYYFRGDVKNNNVLFANMCWKAVRTTSTGGTKLIYAGIPFNTLTNATYNGATDSSVDPTKLKCTQDASNIPITRGDNATIGKSAFNTGSSSPAYLGYMYGDSSYIDIRNDNPPAGTVYANDVSWDGAKYALIDTVAVPEGGQSATRPGATKPFYQEIAEKYHYTCGNTVTTCAEVRYTHYTAGLDSYNNHYLTLKNGKNIEQAKVEMYQNTNSSTIKTFIDNWYNGNSTNGLHAHEKLKDYADKLEDTAYCSDRTFATGPMKSKDDGLNAQEPKFNTSYHSAYGRNIETRNVKPSLSCINQNDKLTAAELGNKLGLLTADEATLAGSGSLGYNYYSYLTIGSRGETSAPLLLSPGGLSGNVPFASYVYHDGRLSYGGFAWSGYMARPSISLSSASLVIGDGTIERPWVVQ